MLITFCVKHRHDRGFPRDDLLARKDRVKLADVGRNEEAPRGVTNTLSKHIKQVTRVLLIIVRSLDCLFITVLMLEEQSVKLLD